MPWAVLVDGKRGIFHRLDPVTGDVLTSRVVTSRRQFKYLLDGLFLPSGPQPVDVYTYGAYQWPQSIRTLKTIDLKYKYADHHGREPDAPPENILDAIKNVIVQSRYKLVSARGKEFYFWLPSWK